MNKMGLEKNKSILPIGACAGQLEKALAPDSGPSPTADCLNNRPHAHFRLRTLCLVGALLPGLGCYACLFYTFLFQQDRIRNFTTSNCPTVQSSFPPVSYSIGVWEPQKSFWLFILFLHVPARLFFGIAYKAHFAVGESEYKQRKWYPRMVKAHLRLILVEIFGLIAVSIVDIQSHFVWHAIFYAIWLSSFNFNMLFNTLLFHHSGIRSLRKPHLDRIFYLKCILCYAIAYPLSVSTGLTYFGYLFTCNGLSYALFSLAEYIIVGLNSFWYFLLIWELDGCEMELYVRQ